MWIGIEDKINKQVKAVLAYLMGTDLSFSWDDNEKEEKCNAEVFLWLNGRERGYCISFREKYSYGECLNIAFFEHRNSDNICILRWESDRGFFNHATEEADIFEKAYGGGGKYDVYKSFKYGEAAKAAEFIMKEAELWWKKTFPDDKNKGK